MADSKPPPAGGVCSRKEYICGSLDLPELCADPIEQFDVWYRAAQATGIQEANAMTLATASSDGRPSARTVLLKAYDERGFVFFTNYLSRKGVEIESNPSVALLFYWPALERQVRIEGAVSRTSDAESDDYFRSRPRGAQLGASVSPQSEIIASRAVLEDRLEVLMCETAGREVARPAVWGGYRVAPAVVEFWQGRENRLHDRLRYSLAADGRWNVDRLAP